MQDMKTDALILTGGKSSRMGGRLYEKARADYSIETMAEKQKAIYSTIEAREKRTGRCGAVLCGAYGRGNSGDEAILKAICLRLRSIEPDIPIWVMTRDPKGTSKSANVRGIYIFNVLRFIRALRRSTLFVNGGGSLIQDVTSARSLYFYLFTLIAAKKLGCGRALALDIDPQAVEIARENAENNGISDGIEWTTRPLERVRERFGLVLANIFSNVLCHYAPRLSAATEAGGRLILTGILAEQVPEVQELNTGLQEHTALQLH